MKGPMQVLIETYAKQQHPLATGIAAAEVPGLIKALATRLEVSPPDLELSCKGLKRLEVLLPAYYGRLQARQQALDDETTLQLLRELGAYIGEATIQETQGRWAKPGINLWMSGVEVDGPWQVVKGQEYTSIAPALLLVGGDGAAAWDNVQAGHKPDLYRHCRSAKRRQLREKRR